MMVMQPIEYEKIPIESFTSKGTHIYAFDNDSHIFWDVCSCPKCCVNDDEEYLSPKDLPLSKKFLMVIHMLTLLDNH